MSGSKSSKGSQGSRTGRVRMEMGTSSVLILPYTASSVGVARRRLMGDLSGAGVFETTACDAGLVLSELISNALRHGAPLPDATVRVSWQLDDDCLEIAVSDGGGPTVPAVNEPGSSAIGGRGLGIVDRLSLRWGVCAAQEDGGGETTVWAKIALDCTKPDKQDEQARADQHPETGDTGNRGSDSGRWSQLRASDRGANDDGLVIASSRDA
jgi:anti-sigma regulatory factor (Ser/Thr protein kinase)